MIRWGLVAGILLRIDGLNTHFVHVAQDCLMVAMNAVIAGQPGTDATIAKIRMNRINLIDVPFHLQISAAGGTGR